MLRGLRQRDPDTPYVLMGYYNPIYRTARRLREDAVAAGVDGAIIVDLPPEEDEELALPARRAGSILVQSRPSFFDQRRRSPPGESSRMPAAFSITFAICRHHRGTRSADAADVRAAVDRPCARFTTNARRRRSIRHQYARRQAAEGRPSRRAAVVGSAVVRSPGPLQPRHGGPRQPGLVDAVLADIRALAAGVRGAADHLKRCVDCANVRSDEIRGCQ